PHLVADAEEGHFPRLVAAVGAPLPGKRGALLVGHVLDPLGHLPRRAAAGVAGGIGVGAQQLGEIHELVGAEAVGLLHATPVGVDLAPALVARADAAAPVGLVGETTAGPAQHRHVQLPQRGQHVVAVAAGVGDLRILAHPDAAVDAVAQVLGELAEDIAADGVAGLVGAQGGAGL